MKFRGHETFSIRKGWLNKGIQNIENCPGVFLGDAGNSMDVLGIGANMVKSLRYWMLATNIASEPLLGHRVQTLTELGRTIYNNDPYFEESGSLCLIHYELACNEDIATSWFVFHYAFDCIEFSEEDFQVTIRKYVRMRPERDIPSERSISDDFKCLINTYNHKQTKVITDPEDNIESPLTELGLIEYLYNKNNERIYKKVMIKDELLPDLISLAIIIKNSNGNRELKISSLIKEDKCLGKAFNLDMIRIINILYRLEKAGYVKVIRTAGLDVVEIITEMSYIDCINLYYETLNQN